MMLVRITFIKLELNIFIPLHFEFFYIRCYNNNSNELKSEICLSGISNGVSSGISNKISVESWMGSHINAPEIMIEILDWDLDLEGVKSQTFLDLKKLHETRTRTISSKIHPIQEDMASWRIVEQAGTVQFNTWLQFQNDLVVENDCCCRTMMWLWHLWYRSNDIDRFDLVLVIGNVNQA